MARANQHRNTNESSEAAATFAEETGRTGAEILTMTARMAEQSVARFSHMIGVGSGAGKTDEQHTRRMEVLQECGSALGKGYQDIWQECVSWTQGQFQANLTAVSRLMQCRTPQELIAAQNQLFGENIALAITANRRIADISKEMADHAAEKITELANQTEQAGKRAA